MIWKYISDKRRHVTPVHAVIADVLKFEQGQKKKMLKPNASYYPILKYEWKGEERAMRSNYLSLIHISGICFRFYRTDRCNCSSDPAEEPGSDHLWIRTGILRQCDHRCICKREGRSESSACPAVHFRTVSGLSLIHIFSDFSQSAPSSPGFLLHNKHRILPAE